MVKSILANLATEDKRSLLDAINENAGLAKEVHELAIKNEALAKEAHELASAKPEPVPVDNTLIEEHKNNVLVHKQGLEVQQVGKYANADGVRTIAIGDGSYAGGINTKALTNGSYAIGENTVALSGFPFRAYNYNKESKSVDIKVSAFDLQTFGWFPFEDMIGTSLIAEVRAGGPYYTEDDPYFPVEEPYRNEYFTAKVLSVRPEIDFEDPDLDLSEYQDYRNPKAFLLTLVLDDNKGAENIQQLYIGYKVDIPSYAEGFNTISTGGASHAEGQDTKATGLASHSEGIGTWAMADGSRASGERTVAFYGSIITVQDYSIGSERIFLNSYENTMEQLAEIKKGSMAYCLTRNLELIEVTIGENEIEFYGYDRDTVDDYRDAVEARGWVGIESDVYIEDTRMLLIPNNDIGSQYFTAANSAEGVLTFSGNMASHAEGLMTTAAGPASHAEGSGSSAIGETAHAEGYDTKAIGSGSHAEGGGSSAYGEFSHAEGMSSYAHGEAAHAEGLSSYALGPGSHAEGWGSQSIGEGAHAEGWEAVAEGDGSHAEGYGTNAIGDYSHTEGVSNFALTKAAHAKGERNFAYSGDLYKVRSVENVEIQDSVWAQKAQYVIEIELENKTYTEDDLYAAISEIIYVKRKNGEPVALEVLELEGEGYIYRKDMKE